MQRGLNAAKRAVGAESKVQPIAQKEDALSPVRTPSHRLTSPLKQKNTDSAPEVCALAASRLRRKKEKLKAFSTANAVDEKIQNEYRRKRILQEEAVTSKRELQDMALEEGTESEGLYVRRPRHGLHLQGEGVSTVAAVPECEAGLHVGLYASCPTRDV